LGLIFVIGKQGREGGEIGEGSVIVKGEGGRCEIRGILYSFTVYHANYK
jgi:hypothetical protein